ncbi:hypothetical protein E4U13_007111 [Claviceps humidiphila]|uniref:Uncharacterized protein n=1 Tax=Claviceps humidiphila TaxID=1294629 RepID=A0A9P7PVJ0_9HYPO|nr:hypothetical protein E4U13_007111 [Claviceps humidiphila]
MMVATTPMKHLQKNTTIPSDRFTLRKTMPLNAFHMKKIIRTRFVGSSMERRAVVGRKGGDYRYNDTEQPELDRLRIKWVPRSAVESSDHIHTVFFLEILSIIGRPDLERPYQNWIFHSRNQ